MPSRLSFLALLVFLVTACGDTTGEETTTTTTAGTTTAAAVSHEVLALDRRGFDPVVVTISVGDSVEWIFPETNSVPHDSVGDDWDSGITAPGEESFVHTFDAAGTFDYVCTLHDGMAGTVVVGP